MTIIIALLLFEPPVLPNKLSGLKQNALVLAVLLVFVPVALLLVVLLPTLALAVVVPKSREVRSAIVELLRT
jgi:hypothetical protein